MVSITPCIRCTSISFLYSYLICMYLIPATTAFSRITLGALKSRGNWEETKRGKILLQLIILLYINYQYIKTAEKMTVRRMFFFYCNGKLDLMLKRKDGALYVIIVITSLHFFFYFVEGWIKQWNKNNKSINNNNSNNKHWEEEWNDQVSICWN